MENGVRVSNRHTASNWANNDDVLIERIWYIENPECVINCPIFFVGF